MSKTKRVVWSSSIGIVCLVGILGVCLVFRSKDCSNGASFAQVRHPELNFLLITIDTLRADHVGAYGYPDLITPTLDRLAQNAIVFDYAYATAPFTGPSHASILTSQHPSSHGVVFNGHRSPKKIKKNATTVAEYLRGYGYRTAAMVAAGPVAARYGFARGFEDFHHVRESLKGEAGAPGAAISRRAEAWLEAHSGVRFFLWLHYFDPHLPYTVPSEIIEELGIPDPGRVDHSNIRKVGWDVVRQAYRADVYEADKAIGSVIAAMADLGLNENTIVAVVSDHGEYLGEHGYIDHHSLFDPVLHVPMFIHSPTVDTTVRITTPVSTIDLIPSVLRQLGVGSLPGAQGQPISVTPERKTDSRPVFAEWRDHRILGPAYRTRPWDFSIGVQIGKTKLMQSILVPTKVRLYDLSQDPGELHDLSTTSPKLLGELKRVLVDHTQNSLPEGVLCPEGVKIDEKSLQMLRSLGYL